MKKKKFISLFNSLDDSSEITLLPFTHKTMPLIKDGLSQQENQEKRKNCQLTTKDTFKLTKSNLQGLMNFLNI